MNTLDLVIYRGMTYNVRLKFGKATKKYKNIMVALNTKRYFVPVSFGQAVLLAKTLMRMAINRPYDPVRLQLTVSHKCNARCKMCSLWKFQEEHDDTLPLSRVLSVIADLKRLKTKEVFLQGGEPFLYKYFWQTVNALTRASIGIILNTNGSVMSNNIAERLIRHSSLVRLNFSLDSAIESEHDDIRGFEGLYRLAIKNMTFFAKYVRESGSNVYLNIHCVLNRINYRNLDKLIGLAAKMRFHQVSILAMALGEDWLKKKENDVDAGWRQWARNGREMVLSQGEVDYFVDIVVPKMLDKAKRLGVTCELPGEIKNLKLILGGKLPTEGKTCTVPFRYCIIAADGNVYPCPCTTSEEYSAGNIKSEDFSKIWIGKKFNTLRELARRQKLAACKECSRNWERNNIITGYVKKIPFIYRLIFSK